MTNRISAVLTDVDKEAVKTSLLASATKLPFLITATAEEKKARQNLGDSTNFVSKGIKVAQLRPEILPGTFIKAEYDKDDALYRQLYELYLVIAPLQQKIEDTMTILGQELMAQTNEVYFQLKVATKKDSSLQPLFDEIKPFYQKTSKKATKEIKQASVV